MARGFDSKSVTDQQESAFDEWQNRPKITRSDPALMAKRRRIELSLADVRHQIERAHSETHREMLRSAAADLERTLSALPVDSGTEGEPE